MVNGIRRTAGGILLASARAIGFKQAEATIVGDSQNYWNDPSDSQFRSNSHWRGQGGLSHDVWMELGEIHLALLHEFIPLTNLTRPLERTVEWGTGGGANAVHFAKETRQFVGVDVSQSSLDECANNVRESGSDNFLPVLIDVAHPEAALELIPGPCDLYLSTYVFELIPTPEYGERLLRIAHRVLRPGGLALIQIKYATSDLRTQSRRWGYRANPCNMTTYAIDRFWEMTVAAGFKPKAVTLQPKQPLVQDERYAYFILDRP